MTEKKRFVDVDDYLLDVPRDDRKVLEDLRKTIKETAPEAEEVISYGIPTYKFHGPLVHFKAGKKFFSLITTSRSVVESLSHDLEGYEISGTTIHFTAEKPLPSDLVRRIIELRLMEIGNG